MKRKGQKVGLWMIGAAGGVGSTVALGVAALRLKRTATTGLVTDLPPFQNADLIDPAALEIGGHEIRRQTLLQAVKASHQSAGLFETELIKACSPALNAMQRNIKPGVLTGASTTVRNLADRSGTLQERTPANAIKQITHDLNEFKRKKRLDHLVVINLASSEPPLVGKKWPARYDAFHKALTKNTSLKIPPSSLYALAALEAGCAFINFTPSPGVSLPAIQERADQLGLPYMGNDGKTGETLVKSVLAPLFAMRHLKVLSWVGQNLLGNRDGMVLSDPKTRASKINSKDRIVRQIVGGSPTTKVSIEYVPSLDDWKVAWDFIHFEGFLGTKMNMQFTWQGSDSILAAPLVIDLARLSALELQRGISGPMRHLAFFFKDPLAVDRDDLFSQWEMLIDRVTKPQSASSP